MKFMLAYHKIQLVYRVELDKPIIFIPSLILSYFSSKIPTINLKNPTMEGRINIIASKLPISEILSSL